MGAWGEKPFENDSALDWLGDLDGVEDLRSTLASVADGDDYLEVDDCSAAIAAAEIVAAACDGKLDRLAEDASAWLGRHGKQLAASDRALAARAVQRVLGSDSELAELWDEGGTDNEWRRDAAGLVARLAGR
jgi:hypothetical protein